jgi:hypothetical protein
MKQKKQEQKHDTYEIKIQQDFIAKNKQKYNKVMTRNIPKISVEQIKGNGEFYLYSRKLFFQFTCGPCAPMCTHV